MEKFGCDSPLPSFLYVFVPLSLGFLFNKVECRLSSLFFLQTPPCSCFLLGPLAVLSVRT